MLNTLLAVRKKLLNEKINKWFAYDNLYLKKEANQKQLVGHIIGRGASHQ